MVFTVVAGLSGAIWLYLALLHGRFWTTAIRLPETTAAVAENRRSVVAVVPARDEAAMLPLTLPTLTVQDYDGPFRVIVIDDDSSDGTATLAKSLGAEVLVGRGPAPGWSGKVAAMDLGVAAAGACDYVLFTDADIAFPPHALTALIASADANDLVLTSQMARLRCEAFWERMIVPAFVYFFAQLFPFARVNGCGRTAAAAGGCVLVRREALVGAGGLARISNAVIDDVALARLLTSQGRIWLGLSDEIHSVRPYPRLLDLWRMVSRSAYTQLRYSPLLLVATVLGLG
ncbi:MAG: glycosyltransferase, partial [Actinobacteria bacterium]|nr:glycosyltransferase [Actinomycetota bacterium]